MKKLLFALMAISFLLSGSCRKNTNDTTITSGRIDYKITYLDHPFDEKNLELMPKSMKLFFNKKKATNFIEGFMGLYKLNAYTDFHNRTCSTMLKVFDRYYVFKGKRDEMMCCFDAMENMKIEYTGETKVIAGFNCKKSIIHVPSISEPFVIYYTNDIELKHPNVSNPYKNIDGVLMEFELKLLDVRMRFTAEKYQPLTSGKLDTEFPKKTKVITRDQMNQLLARLLEF